MKKTLTLTLLSTSLFAAELVPEEGFPTTEPHSFTPFSINGTTLSVANADFRSGSLEGQHLKYAQNNIAFGYLQPFNEIWGLIFGAGYVGTEVKWHENPDFLETQFAYVNFSAGAFTNAMPGWTWTLTVSAFVDTAVLDLSDYALYQGVIYGEYEICKGLDFDAGFILEVGTSHGKAWPILGFSWEPCNYNWRIHAIYPLDISVQYDIFPAKLTVGAAARFLRDRHRVLETEPLPLGVYEYDATGAELNVIFSPRTWFIVKGFGGSTFGGDLKIANRNNHHAEHFKFRSSYYYGLNAILTF